MIHIDPPRPQGLSAVAVLAPQGRTTAVAQADSEIEQLHASAANASSGWSLVPASPVVRR
jgi:hypothetical protein